MWADKDQNITQNRYLPCHHLTSAWRGTGLIKQSITDHEQPRSTGHIKKKSVGSTPRLFKGLGLRHQNANFHAGGSSLCCLKAHFLFMDDICRIQLNACMEGNYFSCRGEDPSAWLLSPSSHRPRHNQSVCCQPAVLSCRTEYVNRIDTGLFLTVGLSWGWWANTFGI